jgi:hypothetical protein
MFCHIKEEDKGRCMGCGYKIVSEIISFLAVIFSIFVIVITVRKTKMNIINKLIVQILISEVLDGLNILLVIFDDYQGSRIFENYNSKTYICYSQIFLSLFTCLWTLSASFFISLRIYDIMIKKGRIFKNKFLEKYVLFFSVIIPAFISYFFWLGQVISQANKIKDVNQKGFYQKYHSHSHFRHMYCWVDSDRNYAIFSIVIVLIGANVYFSIIKGTTFLNKVSGELKDEDEEFQMQSVKRKISDMEHIKKSLWIYPLTSGILWTIFFIIQILFNEVERRGFLSWIYCILISIRQGIYTFIFVYTQKDIKYQFMKFILCKNRTHKTLRNTKGIINELKSEEKIIPDDEKSM